MQAIILQFLKRIIINRASKALVDWLLYAFKKMERNKKLKENQKKLDEAIASGDKDAITKASEDAINGK